MLCKICNYIDKVEAPEWINKEDMKAFAINLLADIMVEYKAEQLEELANKIKL